MNFFRWIVMLALVTVCQMAYAHDSEVLVKKIQQNAASIVGIALYAPIESKAPVVLGTGFIIADGKYVVTNYHVVSKELDPTIVQNFVALSGRGSNPSMHVMELLEIDPVHDLALLSIKSTIPAVSVASDQYLSEGTSVFFTGFPLGSVLGLYPATHTGIIAALAPDVNPARNSNELTKTLLSRLKTPFLIYQLDATAYPGNSGSPVFDSHTGQVVGVINKVFVSQGKESALTAPSGISYAIPVRHVRELAARRGVSI